ncbi:MAG: hypothetical protein AAF182_01625 [Pseudomonadota bacterium]
MHNITPKFKAEQIHKIDLNVPPIALATFRRMAEITDAKNICIGGGFIRGLYMQQYLKLNPKMNDIDVFADMTMDKFQAVRKILETQFGTQIRVHIGTFDDERCARGLIEFALPEYFQDQGAGVSSVQLNFGPSHKRARLDSYMKTCNAGVNHGVIDLEGQSYVSSLFLSDITQRTITMNPRKSWTVSEWDSSMKTLTRMRDERPEFHGWKIIQAPRPSVEPSGLFWDEMSALKNEMNAKPEV